MKQRRPRCSPSFLDERSLIQTDSQVVLIPDAPASESVASDSPTFHELDLSHPVRQAVEAAGYTSPTSIQSEIIPHMLMRRDVLAQSQTGTGKTAAFALPILSLLDVDQRHPQVLVLTPTRELAIQVANSFQSYGACLEDLSIATIYGGQSYEPQCRSLQGGAQIVVGTPGRIIDHIHRGTLDISRIQCLVLDEADEMLNMGFLEDVQFVLEQAPPKRQIALFSATLPGPIQQIAEQYLNDPARISIQRQTLTADSIRQRAIFVAPRDKVDALHRLIDFEETDGVIVFTKTKAATITVAESLSRRGLSAVALNGDMPQATRERTVQQFKSGRLDVLVATDVAARGLDVSRVSHVFNFDPPHDSESYIHRVGRTGRAGRAGEAYLLLSNAQRGKLRLIEKATKQRIEIVTLPSTGEINERRKTRFKQRITETVANHDLSLIQDLITAYASESGQPIEVIAAALAHLAQQGQPLLEPDRPKRSSAQRDDGDRGESTRKRRAERERFGEDDHRSPEGRRKPRALGPVEPGMQRYRIQVGWRDGVKPGNIVGAVANEAGLDGQFIGPILIHDCYSLIDLPEGMPRDIFHSLRQTRVAGKPLQIALNREKGNPSDRRRPPTKTSGPKTSGPKASGPKTSGIARKPKPTGKAKKRKFQST